MKDVYIKRSAIILGAGAGYVMLSYPQILCALIAIDLQLFVITLFLSARVDPSGMDHFNHCATTAMQLRAVKNDMK